MPKHGAIERAKAASNALCHRFKTQDRHLKETERKARDKTAPKSEASGFGATFNLDAKDGVQNIQELGTVSGNSHLILQRCVN